MENTITKWEKMKNTRKVFQSMQDNLRKMRKSDPIQFEVLFQEWKRKRENSKKIFI